MIKRLILAVVSILMLSMPLAAVDTVSAVDVIDPVCQNPNITSGNEPQVCKENKAIKGSGEDPVFGPNGLLATVVNILSILGAFIAVIVIMIGGTKMIVSSGDSNNIASSRRTVLYAVISLAIIASAQLVVRLLISKI